MRRRVWCETLTFAEVAAAPTVALLARYRVELLLSVRPWQLAEVGDVVTRLRGAGLTVALWPMLADGAGRWCSTWSSAAFIALGDAVIRAAPTVDELIVDLEPPLATMAAWQRGRPQRTPPSAVTFAAAATALAAAVRRWQQRDAAHGQVRRVTTALMPMLAFERGGTWMQRALGTPATALGVDGHSVMAYTSLFEGWSRGVVGRRRAEAALALCAHAARRRFADLAGLSLGAVGAGAFGDEPAYRDPSELARDVAIARAAGIHDLSLFELGGLLRRTPAEAWLDALCAVA